MKTHREKTRLFGLLRPLIIFGAGFIVIGASADVPSSPLCADGECQPMISVVDYQNREGFKVTDGKSEAIVVPSIGRIMSYKKVGGENLIWNAPKGVMKMVGWNNYGGDKTWLGPQSSWPQWHGAWPPDTSIDNSPHEVEFLTGGKLRMTSPLSPTTGIRFIRTIYFDANGELVIEQTAQKEKGPKVKGSIWNITQAIPGDAIFLPTNEDSPYENKFHTFHKGKDLQKAETLSPKLLRVVPIPEGEGWKIGTDAPVSSLASVKDGVAFVQKTAKPKGTYPDGTIDDAGFPVELFINGDKKAYYTELELLGPLRDFSIGTKWTHTLRWSLHDMPSKDVKSKEVAEAVQNLLLGNQQS